MNRLQRLENKRAELLDQQDAFFKKYDDAAELPADEVKAAETRNNELKTLETQIEQELTLSEMRSATETSLKTLQGELGQVQVVGSEAAGTTVLERNKKGELSVVYEEGNLGLDKKTLSSISTNGYKIAFKNYLRNGNGLHGMSAGDLKTLQEGVDSQGGFLVPEDMMSSIVQKDPTPSMVNSLVSRFQTSRDALTMPKVNYTADDIYTTGMRVKKTGEVPSSSTTHRVTDPVFGQIRIPVHTFMMSLPITLDMLEDSAFALLNWATGKFSETRDLLYDNEIINGNGIGGPSGILLNPGATDQPGVVNSGNASALTGDGLIDLHYSVPPQYRANLRYLMSYMNAAKNLAKLKDAQNRYLFSMGGANDGGLQGDRPDTLIGRPIAYSEFMPQVGANTHPIVFGDLSGYYLVERVGFSIQVLRERYAEDNQVVLLGRVRFGGQVAEPWKIKAQKVAA